ncbi:MAG: sulfite dehydrogenase, partial [Gammaproteobacteria bacterium]|nr:sulfite dehydrogenase [Gammaproteobacteria bacterium]
QSEPAYTREETSKYTELHADGSADMFSLRMAVKSLITSPSGSMHLRTKGVYEISGIAWSGHGAIKKVEVSADGGKHWAEAALQSEPSALCLTRFRIPWQWNGQTAILQSRAMDDKGNLQPVRNTALAGRSPADIYHYNGIQSWQVSTNGRVRNTYA